MSTFSWVATVLVVVLVVTFVGYLVSLRQLPTARRTDLRIFDRFGRQQDHRNVEQPRRK